MIEKNIRLQPHRSRDLLVGRRSDNKRPKYQPPGGGDPGMSYSAPSSSGGGGGNGGWSPSVSYSPPAPAPTPTPTPHVDTAAVLMAEATRMKAERKAIEKAIQEAEQRKVVSPHLEGVDDEGWTRAFESPTNILGDTPEERREKEFLDTGDYETLIAPDLGKRIDTSPKVDVKDIMGEVTDPGSVSYDPTYKTPAEIRTLQGTTDYGQFFRQPTVIETPKTGIGGALKTMGKGALEMALMPFLPKPVRTAWTTYKRGKQAAAFAKRLGINIPTALKFTKPDTQKEATKKLVSRTSEDHEPTIQEAVAGKDVVTETAKKYTSLTNDQVSDLRKIIAGKDSKELQRIFKLAERRMEAGDASDVEKDVFALIQEYLVSIRPIAAYGGSVDKALTGRSRDI